MTAWRWSAIGAIATLAIGAGFALVPGIDACGPAHGAGQWVDFQNITSVADVQALIRPECADRFVPALRASMWLDALAFIPAYALFLGGLIFALQLKGWDLAILGLALVNGIIADQIEGWELLDILNSLPPTTGQIDALARHSALKETSLLLATGWIGLELVRSKPAWWFAGLLTAILSFGAVVGNWFGSDWAEISLLVAWLILAVVSVAGAVAEWRQARSAAAVR